MLNVLIKPASSLCDMRCDYCFYHDLSSRRDVAFKGIMTKETADTLISRAFDYAKRSVLFAFQGGEPLLSGLEFFIYFAEKVKEKNVKNIQVTYSLQTNGLNINTDWALFFRKYNFLIGLSFDGDKNIHDKLRRDKKGNKTHSRVLNAARILNKYHVEYNILTVVTLAVAGNIDRIYAEMKKHGFRYLQFIPCLNPLESDKILEYTLESDDYGYFLKTLFNLWYNDFMNEDYYSIRYFDNLYFAYIGKSAEQCGMQGHCNIQFVIEGDGTVYPCDFYCLDEYILGNIKENSFKEMQNSRAAQKFLSSSSGFGTGCKNCEAFRLCKSGCRRYKDSGNNYIYCETFKDFCKFAEPKLEKIKKKISSQAVR